MNCVYYVLGRTMDWCYGISGSYGWAIVLFTFLTKIMLLPLSLWTYFNGITMIKIQPDINFIKVKYYGQKDQIAEEQAKLFKEKKYSPLASVIPTFVQLLLLAGVVGVIKLGINNPAIDMNFFGVNLGAVPAEVGMELLWSPLVAGIAAFILCIAQNASSVLQSEQSKYNKWGMTIFSVGLSLYLGWFVAVGTAFYWVCSNLFAVLQLYICNWIIRPHRFIDYDRLEESRKELAEIQKIGTKKRESYFSENRRRERADYKRFFSVVNKHLVFYSESNGFLKYFKGVIEYLLEHTNITIHYITSDPNDQIFEMEKNNPKLRGYYIGENKLITLMMKIDADVVCMTMPDLDNYHIKKSYLRKDIEYVYLPHGMNSGNMTTRPGARDNFDTIFVAGPHQRRETEQLEIEYNTKRKNIVDFGYCLLDDMIANYENIESEFDNESKSILIAPSWQENNIIDLCLDEVIEPLLGKGYEIIIRPHPQHVRHNPNLFEALKEKYSGTEVDVQTDFTSNNPVMSANVLITDWSGIAWEYSFTTLRPTLYINTPMKILNPEYDRIAEIPVDISLRNKLGKALDIENLDMIASVVSDMIDNEAVYSDRLRKLRGETIYNVGKSGEVGGRYIVEAIQRKIAEKRKLK